MRLVRTGITRGVLVTRRYAIKFPRIRYGWKKFIEGINCNLSENEVWNVTRSEYLCPVLFHWAGFILVMPKVEILKKEEEIPSIHLSEPGSDPSSNNYGVHNGKIVCIDYPYHRLKPYKR